MIQGQSASEIINYFEGLLKTSNEFHLLRLTPRKLKPNPTSIVDDIFSNKNNVIINQWSFGVVITSATFFLVRKSLAEWPKFYDKKKA